MSFCTSPVSCWSGNRSAPSGIRFYSRTPAGSALIYGGGKLRLTVPGGLIFAVITGTSATRPAEKIIEFVKLTFFGYYTVWDKRLQEKTKSCALSSKKAQVLPIYIKCVVIH